MSDLPEGVEECLSAMFRRVTVGMNEQLPKD
jgi:hypothetical protein